MSWILTFTGRKFDLLSPDVATIEIEDIAHSLAFQCRFGGHTTAFYSVAQHCVMATTIVPLHLQLAALMHDAAEAYIGDIKSPLKSLLDVSSFEFDIELTICERFGIDDELLAHPDVKHADLVMLATERRDLMPPNDEPWPCLEGITPLADPIEPWPAEYAKKIFLHRYLDLTKLSCSRT